MKRLLLFLMGVLAGCTVYWIVWGIRPRLREESLSSRCYGHQAQTYIALEEYRAKHGSFPASLDALVQEGMVKQAYLSCPASGRRYIYFLEALEVSEEDRLGNHPMPILACPGFAHGPLKRYAVDIGEPFVTGATAREVIDRLEADRVKLAEALRPGAGEVLKRLLERGATPSSSDSPREKSGT